MIHDCAITSKRDSHPLYPTYPVLKQTNATCNAGENWSLIHYKSARNKRLVSAYPLTDGRGSKQKRRKADRVDAT